MKMDMEAKREAKHRSNKNNSVSDHEPYEYSSRGSIGTSKGDLLKGFKL